MSDSRVCLAGLLIGLIIVYLVRFEGGASTGVSWVGNANILQSDERFLPKTPGGPGLSNSKPCFRTADPLLPAPAFGISPLPLSTWTYRAAAILAP